MVSALANECSVFATYLAPAQSANKPIIATFHSRLVAKNGEID